MKQNRIDIKAALSDPLLKKELIEGATDFICKVEGIRPSFETKGGEASKEELLKALEQLND